MQLSVIFITNFCLNIVELGFPYGMNWLKNWKEERRMKKLDELHPDRLVRRTMTDTERQASLNPYESPLEDYMELVIQYGYIVLFSAAFTLTPFLAFFLNLLEVRVDAYKLVNLT
jgi:hypothetical protein